MADTTFVDGQTVIPAAWLNDVNNAVYNPAAAIIPASSIVNTPAGTIAAVDVQTALNELDTEKIATSAIGTSVQAYDALLAALAAQTTAANNVQAYSGADAPTLLSTGTSSGNIPLIGTKSATDALAGLVELATTAEAAAGTDTDRAVTAAGVATANKVKAWVNFNGTGVVAIRASSNVSSITDNGTGDYTVNLTSALADANYAVVYSSGGTAGSVTGGGRLLDDTTARTTSAFRLIAATNSSFTPVDVAQVNVAVFR